MSAALPTDIRDRIRQKIWAKADELDWPRISDLERATWYENWSKDKDIGGVLSHFMDARKVRVYIKDSLLKPYLRTRLQDGWEKVLLAIDMVEREGTFKKSYDKPHGRLLLDGRVICWGNSRDWKLILISVFERAYQLDTGVPYAVALVENGKATDAGIRELILAASQKLGVHHLVWID
jgi:hypothetical protein